MPDNNQAEPCSLFSNDPDEVKKVEEVQPASEPISRWAKVSGLVPGVILLVVSFLFLLSNYEILTGEWWQYFLALLLVVFLIEYWMEFISPTRGRLRLKMGVTGLFLVTLGILFLFNNSIWWPLVLLAVGLLLIIRFLITRRRTCKSDESARDNTLKL